MRNKIFILALIVIVAFIIFYAANFFISRQAINNIKAIEIKDYQGEKLDSVSAFRENSIKGPQTVDLATYQLKISGLVDNPLNLTYDQVLADKEKIKKVVQLDCVEGWSAKVLWEGIALRDLLTEASVKDTAKTVIFRAVDGYSTSFPLDYIINNNIIIADKVNGAVLAPELGFPFILVAESKWGYKWIRWLSEIELSADINYQGYWESRGYSDFGNLNENFLK